MHSSVRWQKVSEPRDDRLRQACRTDLAASAAPMFTGFGVVPIGAAARLLASRWAQLDTAAGPPWRTGGRASNTVVWLGVIERWAPVEGERVRFTARPLSNSEIEVARSAAISVAASAPSWALWRQGQGNPVRVGPHLGIGSDDAPTGGDKQTIHLGVFKIVYDPNSGELRVFAPAGAQVLISAQP